MAFQSQTYANSNSGYYVENAAPFNPSTVTALNGPVEILFTSTIAGAYHGTLNQTPSTFIISENDANLSTINSLVMDPTVPKTTMNIYDVNNPLAEPVIQQWTNVSSIVNGIFKVGNKQLGTENNALVFENFAGTSLTAITQESAIIAIDGTNERTTFHNTGQLTNKYIEIGQSLLTEGTLTAVDENLGYKISINPDTQNFIKANTVYGRTGVNSGAPNQYYMSARTQMDFVTDEVGVAPTALSLKQNGTAVFLSTVFAPTISTTTVRAVDISTTNIVATNANLDTISTLRINQKGPSGQPIFVAGSIELRRIPGPNGVAGVNALTSPRVIINDSGVTPKVYFPPTDNQAQLQQGAIGGGGALPDPPPTATNSLEIVASSALTEGGVQFYNAKSGTSPEWMGGFLKNPKSFNVAPAYTANLYGGVSTTTLFANTAVSTPVVRVSNFINVNPSGYITVGAGGYISTPTVNATSSITTNYLTATSSMKSAIVTITNNNSSQFALYPNQYGNFQGQMIYNTLRDNRGAPATTYESLEIVNVSGGAQTGGIQFYTSNNGDPTNPKWMGGFLQNNVGAGQSEFRLASTVTASMPQLRDVSTINTLPITSYGNPVGTMLNWCGQNASLVPAGYLLCDGSEYPIAGIYNNLYNVIGSWGNPPSSPSNFRIPDSRGKTLLGSLTIPTNAGPAGAYTISVLFRNLFNVTLPASWGGGTRTCMYIQNPTGQIFTGMRVLTAGFNNTASVLGFINSDGLYGNTTPVPPPPTASTASIIIFDASMTNSGPTNVTIQLHAEINKISEFPYIKNAWDNAFTFLGVGNYNRLQKEFEIGAHQHVQQQGGVQGQSGLGPRCGDPNVGGPNTNTNGGLFSYQDPISGLTTNAPMAVQNLPYNIATWQIIKF
jgi:hypothetical protein